MLDGLDHVQLAMPLGGEERARAYFGGMLGLAELEKPAMLAGGAWFGMPDGRQIHLCVEEPFRPGRRIRRLRARRWTNWRGGSKRVVVRCGGIGLWRHGGGSTVRTRSGTGWSFSKRFRSRGESFPSLR